MWYYNHWQLKWFCYFCRWKFQLEDNTGIQFSDLTRLGHIYSKFPSTNPLQVKHTYMSSFIKCIIVKLNEFFSRLRSLLGQKLPALLNKMYEIINFIQSFACYTCLQNILLKSNDFIFLPPVLTPYWICNGSFTVLGTRLQFFQGWPVAKLYKLGLCLWVN
jgi:hypothetical protein